MKGYRSQIYLRKVMEGKAVTYSSQGPREGPDTDRAPKSRRIMAGCAIYHKELVSAWTGEGHSAWLYGAAAALVLLLQ